MINVTNTSQPYAATKFWADMDETEFAKKATDKAGMWKELMGGAHSVFSGDFDWNFLFGLQQDGKQDYRQIFALKDIQKVDLLAIPAM